MNRAVIENQNLSFFYHIYPLGFCDAPKHNDFTSQPVNRLEKILEWLPHIRSLGANALYLGPVFESTAHGYDTADYYQIDRRLGDQQMLARLSDQLHHNGMRLVLDGVFNHVGRDFWAFRDIQRNQEGSPYRHWFDDLRFDSRSPQGDAFTYQPWNGCYDLVRLDQHNPDVREHIFEAVRFWIKEFDIDGLRLDAADSLDFDFMHLHLTASSARKEFTTSFRSTILSTTMMSTVSPAAWATRRCLTRFTCSYLLCLGFHLYTTAANGGWRVSAPATATPPCAPASIWTR